jgi:CDP-diacylglycerol--glycerol-3-phosphate 3-phosphatidyltransferase
MKILLTIPNLLSILRLFFTLVFVLALWNNRVLDSIIILCICILTDFFDGFFARVFKQKTKLGVFLDSFADKVLVISTLLILMIKNYLPWWFFSIIIVKEILVAAGWIITYQHNTYRIPKPRFLGKISIALEMITLAVVILNAYLQYEVVSNIINELFFLTSIFAASSLVDYIGYARKTLSQ